VGVTLVIATHDESAVARAGARATVRSVQLKGGEVVA
jgi:ABC-type ATPase involved in cell division